MCFRKCAIILETVLDRKVMKKKHATALELLFRQVSVRISSTSMAYSSGKKAGVDILGTAGFH